ncbi:hypothetical protein VTK73DRAFT_157 [Phialemonium thermophilum]|uniref:Uncharacterized protein n=1 Tax=Phialemonium thermophilum TaxID=223376 RepID=A0ABR3VWX7_9PEZI
MSDGVRFLDLPPWSQMNFSRNCTVWRDWMSVIATPIATNPEDSVGPSIPQGIELFAAAAPANLSLPANKTEGEFYATIAEWYTYNIFYTWDAAAGQWNQTPDFYQRVLIEPMAACPDEYCEATNQDK